MLQWKNQIPILAPDNVSVLDSETAKFAWVKVFVVLRMRVSADELAYVHRLYSIVVERQADGKVALVFGLDDVKSFHVMFSSL